MSSFSLKTQTTPLLASKTPPELINEPKLYEALCSHLNFSEITSSTHRALPMCLKAILSVGGVLGRIPLVPLSLKFENAIPFLGPCFAFTNFISYSSYLVWASSRMVNQITRSFSVIDTSHSRSELLKKTAGLIFSIISGSAAQIPYFVLSLDYNPQAPYLVGLNALDVTLPIYSLYLTTQNTLPCERLSKIENSLKQLQNNLISRCDSVIAHMKEGVFDDSIDLFQKFDNIGDEEFKLNALMFHTGMHHQVSSSQSPSLGKYSTKFAESLGLILVIAQAAWNGLLAYQGSFKLIKNEAASGVIASYVIICNFALSFFVLMATSKDAVRAAFGIFKKSEVSYLSEALLPRVSKTIKVITQILALCAVIPAAQMSKDYLIEPLFWPSTLAYGLGFIFMDYMPMRALSDDMLLSILRRCGSQHQKQIIKAYDKMLDIRETLAQTPLSSLAYFLKRVCHCHIFSRLLNTYELEEESLDTYLV